MIRKGDNLENSKKILNTIQDDVKWLLYNYELEQCEITKSVEDGREWDYILKIRVGEPKPLARLTMQAFLVDSKR